MSTTALEIDTPQLCATQLVARPGALPTITFPMTRGVVPAVADIWEYLREPAEFFAVPMPGPDELAVAIAGFVSAAGGGPGPALATVSVTIAESSGAPQVLVSGAAATPARPDAVRIAGAGAVTRTHRRTDPWWRRMAARTTSRGDVDQLQRWLNGLGYVDAVAAGVPLLGALVYQRGDDLVGVENPEPTSILDPTPGLRCAAIGPINGGAERHPRRRRACVWWISPGYEVHPVAEVDGRCFAREHRRATRPFTFLSRGPRSSERTFDPKADFAGHDH